MTEKTYRPQFMSTAHAAALVSDGVDAASKHPELAGTATDVAEETYRWLRRLTDELGDVARASDRFDDFLIRSRLLALASSATAWAATITAPEATGD